MNTTQDYNFVEIRKWSISKSRRFMFIDAEQCYAASCFNNCRVNIKVKSVFAKPDSKYHVVICDVPKKDVQKFERAMDGLRSKMLLCGWTSYETDCVHIFREMGVEIE